MSATPRSDKGTILTMHNDGSTYTEADETYQANVLYGIRYDDAGFSETDSEAEDAFDRAAKMRPIVGTAQSWPECVIMVQEILEGKDGETNLHLTMEYSSVVCSVQ